GFVTSGALSHQGTRGLEGQVTVLDGAQGCVGQTAQANDRVVVELGFACTAASVAPVSATAARGGLGTALAPGEDPSAGVCAHPGCLQVDGGLVFAGTAEESPCEPADEVLTITPRRLWNVTVNGSNQATAVT